MRGAALPASRRLEGGPLSEGPGATRSAAIGGRGRRGGLPGGGGAALGPAGPAGRRDRSPRPCQALGATPARRLPAAHARHVPAGRRGARPRLLRHAAARGPSGRWAPAPARAPRGASWGGGGGLLAPPSVPHTNYGAMGSGCRCSRPHPRRCPEGPRGQSPQNPRGALSCGAGLKAWALSSEFRCHHREP